MSTEERRKEIQETRTAHSKMASMLTFGPAYSETVVVKGTDRKDHEVQVHALSTADIQEALEASGLDLFLISQEGQENPEIPRDKALKFNREIAKRATRDPQILDHIQPFEDVKIATKAREISGIDSAPKSPKAA